MLSLLIAEHCSTDTCDHLKDIIKTVCRAKMEVSCSYVAWYVNWKKIVAKTDISTLVHW